MTPTPTTAAFGRWSSVAPPFSATVPLIARQTPPMGMAKRAAARKRTPAGKAPGRAGPELSHLRKAGRDGLYACKAWRRFVGRSARDPVVSWAGTPRSAQRQRLAGELSTHRRAFPVYGWYWFISRSAYRACWRHGRAVIQRHGTAEGEMRISRTAGRPWPAFPAA